MVNDSAETPSQSLINQLRSGETLTPQMARVNLERLRGLERNKEQSQELLGALQEYLENQQGVDEDAKHSLDDLRRIVQEEVEGPIADVGRATGRHFEQKGRDIGTLVEHGMKQPASIKALMVAAAVGVGVTVAWLWRKAKEVGGNVGSFLYIAALSTGSMIGISAFAKKLREEKEEEKSGPKRSVIPRKNAVHSAPAAVAGATVGAPAVASQSNDAPQETQEVLEEGDVRLGLYTDPITKQKELGCWITKNGVEKRYRVAFSTTVKGNIELKEKSFGWCITNEGDNMVRGDSVEIDINTSNEFIRGSVCALAGCRYKGKIKIPVSEFQRIMDGVKAHLSGGAALASFTIDKKYLVPGPTFQIDNPVLTLQLNPDQGS